MLPEISSQQQFVAEDENRHFRTDHLEGDLGTRSMRGGAVTLAVQVLKFLISTASTIVVARLLTPEDYGLVGMVLFLIGFLGLFQYLGLPSAMVRWKELSHAQVSTLFWVNVALSTVIMLAVICSAPLLVWFYKEPRLTGIAAGYAIVIFLTGLSIQHTAILMRQMRFAAIAAIEVSALAVGLCVAIIAALYGAGYWALVLNQLAFALATIVGAWTACNWRPGLPVRGSGVRSMIKYGGDLTGYNFTTFFAQYSDTALIGRFWGAYQLGIYSRAYQMLLMPLGQIITPLAAVAVPALSRLADSPERYRAAYLRILEKIAMLTMPGVAFMIATADWLMLFLLGPKWREAGLIFMLLGIAAIIQPVSKTGAWLFITQGRSREMLKWGIVGAVIAVVSIVAGLPWGAKGVAASYAITDLCISTPIMFWFIGRRGPVRARDVYRTIAPSVCAALVALGVLAVSRTWLALFPYLVTRLALAFGITIATSLLVLAIIPAGRRAMLNLLEMLRVIFKRKSDTPMEIIPEASQSPPVL